MKKETIIGWFVLLCFLAPLFFLGGSQKSSQYGLHPISSFENTESYIRKEVITCLRTGEVSWRGKCFGELAVLLSSQFSLREIINTLSVLDDEEGVRQQCHALTHYLGQEEYKKTGDLGKTFASCLASNMACGEGCLHGSVEGYLFEHGGSLATSSIAAVCSRDFTPNEVTHIACVHGFGHAFMLQFGNDIHASLSSCDALAPLDRGDCYAGVFMENVFGANNPDHPSKFIRPDEPTYPCTTIADRYKDTCYPAQAAMVLWRDGGNIAAAANFCAAVPAPYQKSCYGTLGGEAVVLYNDPADIKKSCDQAPQGPPREECFLQALTFLGHQYQGDAEKLGGLCFLANDKDKRGCFVSAGEVLESWYPEERLDKCEEVNAKGTKEYEWCAGVQL